MERRGFSLRDVEQAIREDEWIPTEYGAGRLECSKEFEYEAEWTGKHYAFQ